MRALLIVVMLLFATAAESQAPESLSQTLPELVAMLPDLIHTQPKPFDFGPASDAITAALRRAPGSAVAAVPILVRELQDPDQDVEFYAGAVLQAFAMQSDGPQLIAPAATQLARDIETGSEKVQVICLVTVGNLMMNAPDAVIGPIERLLLSRPKSERVILAASETLILARPTNEDAQTTVLTVMNDSRTSPELRQQLLYATASPFSGRLIVANIVHVANTTDDKAIRDAAIAAAQRVGPVAVSGIGEMLRRIIADPNEAPKSQNIAAQALRTLGPMK